MNDIKMDKLNLEWFDRVREIRWWNLLNYVSQVISHFNIQEKKSRPSMERW